MQMMASYEDDPLVQGLQPMDTTPIPLAPDAMHLSSIPLSLSEDIIPTFLPPMPPQHPMFSIPNTLLQHDSGARYLSNADTPEFQANSASMLLPVANVPIPLFLNAPMENIHAPLLPLSSSYMPNISTVLDPYQVPLSREQLDRSPESWNQSSNSSPFSQTSSPPSNRSSPSYSGPGVSSHNSTSDTVILPGGRSRANTSISPRSISSHHSSLSNSIDLTSSSPSNVQMEESLSQQHPKTAVGKLLKDIAITAMNAGDAFENCEGAQKTNQVGELRDRISQVLNMLSAMTLPDSDPTTFSPLTPPVHQEIGLDNSTDGTHSTLPVDILSMGMHLGTSDLSRKRCASALDDERTVKSLKREPPEEAPLVSNLQDSSISSPPVMHSFPSTQPFVAMISPNGISPSRPPTPSSAFSRPISYNHVKRQSQSPQEFSTFVANAPAPDIGHTSTSVPISSDVSHPPLHRAPWSDPLVPTMSTVSTTMPSPTINPYVPSVGLQSSVPMVPTGQIAFPCMPPASVAHPMLPNAPSDLVGPPVGKFTRTGSVNSFVPKAMYAVSPYGVPYSDASASASLYQSQSNSVPTTRPRQWSWHSNADYRKFTISKSSGCNASDDEDDEDDSDSDESVSGKTVTHHQSGQAGSMITDLPAEYIRDLDRIFMQFMNDLCSNLDAVDSKGEPIHQTLMAKKMQRLDESPDFRPFKFRILAFTNAFLEELANQGYTEDKIASKKARAYLWRHNVIRRFNEDGKKAKSKGNHTWNVEAKKVGGGLWEFKPFFCKIAGNPPEVAYCGLKWSWKPQLWHPQLSLKKSIISYTSIKAPDWLSWRRGELSGVPPSDAESCEVTIHAKYTLDQLDGEVDRTISITVSHMSAIESAAYDRSGKPPKRSTSDSALFQAPQRAARMTRQDDTHVIRVLQNVAQRVTSEAENQYASSLPHPTNSERGELTALVKQKHLLDQTVDAYDKAISGQGHMDSRRLAVAAQHVVIQAAKTVIADRTMASGVHPQAEGIQTVSVGELTDKTQDAIAMAVKLRGATSNDVDIIVTATSILKAQTPKVDTPVNILAPARPAPSAAAPSRVASVFPASNLPPLPEYC